VYFRGKGHHAAIREAIPVERRGKLRDDVQRITQLLARELEVLIRAEPEQWHLLQPNWPSDHEALAARH
jgi:KDO2-lipid IV(A) lauroyltransferase